MQTSAVIIITSNIGKVTCSFLNSEGGTLYVDIHDQTHTIQGIEIQSKQRDKFKLQVQ